MKIMPELIFNSDPRLIPRYHEDDGHEELMEKIATLSDQDLRKLTKAMVRHADSDEVARV